MSNCEIARAELSIVCTTPVKVTAESLGRARELARWFHGPYVNREHRSILRLLEDEGVSKVMVADVEPRLYHKDQPDQPLFFHPGMAMQRILRMARGEPDRLVAAAGIQSGDFIVDATLGAGGDTLVFAEAVGPTGKVWACEAAPELAGLFTWAQRHQFSPYPAVSHLAKRIEVHIGHHLDWLRQLPTNGADVVYFDPMFKRVSTRVSANMDAIRPFTQTDSLLLTVMEEARRVARRTVVVKERHESGEFARLGLVPDKRRTRFAYGVWKKDGGRRG